MFSTRLSSTITRSRSLRQLSAVGSIGLGFGPFMNTRKAVSVSLPGIGVGSIRTYKTKWTGLDLLTNGKAFDDKTPSLSQAKTYHQFMRRIEVYTYEESFLDRVAPNVIRRSLGLDEEDFRMIQKVIDFNDYYLEVALQLISIRLYPFNLLRRYQYAYDEQVLLSERQCYQAFLDCDEVKEILAIKTLEELQLYFCSTNKCVIEWDYFKKTVLEGEQVHMPVVIQKGTEL